MLVGSCLWVFGGEDAGRRPLAELHALDLASMTWSSPQLAAGSKAPAARSAAGAAAYMGRYLLLFGGAAGQGREGSVWCVCWGGGAQRKGVLCVRRQGVHASTHAST